MIVTESYTQDYWVQYELIINNTTDQGIGRVALYNNKPDYFLDTYFEDKIIGKQKLIIYVPLNKLEHWGDGSYSCNINFWLGEGDEWDQTVVYTFGVTVEPFQYINGIILVREPEEFKI